MKAPTEPQNHVDSFHSPGEVDDLFCNLRQTAATSTAKHGLSPDHRRGNLDRPGSWLPEHLGDNQSYSQKSHFDRQISCDFSAH